MMILFGTVCFIGGALFGIIIAALMVTASEGDR